MSATHDEQENPAAGGEPVAAEQATPGSTVASDRWCSYWEEDDDLETHSTFDTSSVRMPSPEEATDVDEWSEEV